jgi:glycine oxidase
VGSATALALAQEGLKVTLYERDAIASHSSGYAYGGLFPTFGAGIPGPTLEVSKRAIKMHRQLAPWLRDEIGVDPEFRASSSLDVGLTQEGLEELDSQSNWWDKQGFDFERLDASSVTEYERSLTTNIIGGILHRSHFELDSYRFTLGLATAFEKAGGTIRYGAVSEFLPGDAGPSVKLSSGDVITAATIVLCTGPWAGAPDAISGIPSIAVRPVKGEIIRLDLPGDSFRSRVVLGGHYIARKPDGQVWIGTTNEETGFDESPSTAARDDIMAGALNLAPTLEHARVVQQTACLRPTSRDGLPMIGEIAEGVYATNGAGSKGILLSLPLAEMTASLIAGRASSVPIPPEYSVERFL